MTPLKFGFVSPYNEARTVADFAGEAEQAGWDGFFIGENLWHNDAWVSLAAAAMCTSRIRLGTMVSPLPSMQPRKIASETATLDNLSGGRVILSAGMGAVWMGYQGFPDEVTDTKVRAELLDEAINLITLFHKGEPFDYDGKHHHVRQTAVDKMHYPAPPVQRPRVPIWVVCVWPRMKSMRRCLRCDGLIPNKMNAEGKLVDVRPEDVRAMKAFVDAERTLTTPFDIVVEGSTAGLSRAEAAGKLAPWEEAGATWWIETRYGVPKEEVAARLRQGPPRATTGD